MQGRRSKRTPSKCRASLVISLDRKPTKVPCILLDSSEGGFRVRGSFRVRRGHVVEVILDDNLSRCPRCKVVWVGQAGTKQEGEVGLEYA